MDSEFGQWLSQEIERAGIKKGELAHHSGLTANCIPYYLRGQWLPKIDNFRWICEALAYFQGRRMALSRDEVTLLSHHIMIEGLRRI